MSNETEVIEHQEAEQRTAHIGSNDIVSAPLTVAGFVDLVANMEDAGFKAFREATSTKFEILIRSALVMEPKELNDVLRKAYQPAGRGGETDKTLQNWASVVRNCYGAVKFAGVELSSLLNMGRDAASNEAAEALKAASLKWSGVSARDKEEAAKQRRINAVTTEAVRLQNTGKAATLAEAIQMAEQQVEENAANAIKTKYAKRLARLLSEYAKDTGQDADTMDAQAVLSMLLKINPESGPEAAM